MISVQVIEATVTVAGAKLTTLEVIMPRFILPEFNTHRVFSRNVGSSRAIPVAKMIAHVQDKPFIPKYWGANQAGMQAKGELTGLKLALAKFWWNIGKACAIYIAKRLNGVGLHKQLANRGLEPYMYTKVVVTSSEWANFLALRTHPDAQPEMQEVANLMFKALRDADVQRRLLQVDEWHLPYIMNNERVAYANDTLVKMSAARCARTSYMTQAGTVPAIDKELKTYKKLVSSDPIHASPMEHQACAAKNPLHRSRNLVGYIQYREFVEAGATPN